MHVYVTATTEKRVDKFRGQWERHMQCARRVSQDVWDDMRCTRRMWMLGSVALMVQEDVCRVVLSGRRSDRESKEA